MNIGICSHYTTDWSELAEITLPVLDEYCDKHKYHISIQEAAYDKYTGISKILQAKYLLAYNDFVMVMDADTLITNFTIKVEDFIKDGYDLFITKDINGLNAGVFIIRNSEWTFALLDYVLRGIGKGNIHCEQDALNQYINEYGMNKICVVEHPAFNSILYELYLPISNKTHKQGQWEMGDFILHLPALGMQTRLDILKEIKGKIVYE